MHVQRIQILQNSSIVLSYFTPKKLAIHATEHQSTIIHFPKFGKNVLRM